MSTVKIVRMDDNDVSDINGAISEILDYFNVPGAVKGKKVVLKPNLCTPVKYDTGGTTDLRIIDALCNQLSGHCELIIAEGVGRGYEASDVFRRLGLFDFQNKYDVNIVDLEKDERIDMNVPFPKYFSKFKIPKTIANADYVINLPVLKTHNQTTVSLGLKNMFGCLSQMDRAQCHFFGLHEILSDINQVMKSNLIIVDGIYGMEGNGPSSGKARKDNLLITSDDVVASDYFSAKMMGLAPKNIWHIKSALKWSGLNVDEVNIEGELSELSFEGASLELEYNYPLFRLLKRFFLQKYVYLTEFSIDGGKCKQCGVCRRACPQKAISSDYRINNNLCRNCNICREFCPNDAIEIKKKIGFRNIR